MCDRDCFQGLSKFSLSHQDFLALTDVEASVLWSIF